MSKTIVVAGLLLCLYTKGQRIYQGAHYPDETLHHVFNYSSDSLKLSQFKKKLVILDMWDLSCASCIAAFPKIDALQKQFDEEIQIVMVNRQSRDSTERFFARRKKIKLPAVPFVTADKKLNSYFPYDGYPYHVWIDSNQTVRFVTESYNATPEHIRRFLKGEQLTMDSLTNKIYSGSLLKSGRPDWVNQINYYSYVSKCIEGLNIGHASGLTEGEKVKMSSNCLSIAELFQLAYEERGRYNFKLPSKMIVDLPDSYRYVRPRDGNQLDEWAKVHSYNYELVVPAASKDQLHEYMKQDLERYFGIRGSIEKRMISSLVLIRTSKEDKLKTRGGAKEDGLRQSNNRVVVSAAKRVLQNTAFDVLTTKLKGWTEYATGLPFKDGTGYEGNIDIAIDGDAYDSFDLRLLRAELGRYGLDIVARGTETEVLILRRLNK